MSFDPVSSKNYVPVVRDMLDKHGGKFSGKKKREIRRIYIIRWHVPSVKFSPLKTALFKYSVRTAQ